MRPALYGGINNFGRLFLLAVLMLFIASAMAGATDLAAANAKRPKICLVLSGGGARGAAHVGVLKVLEEYRVPVDCIVGTSMGSLVGAAYATGTSLPEIDIIINSISTELLFKENPPRKELAMRRKTDDYSILFGPEVGVSTEGLALGKGVVSGVQLETVLRKLSKEKGYRNFDNLPIQYRAVATDLVTGKAVVFRKGDLARVMRASMSVPGAVAPAEYDGMILVDGMLTSNLPVQTAQALGADIIIAVNVGTPLLRRDQLNGILGVTGQMLSILTEQNVQASLAAMHPEDILISPELGDFSTGDFDVLPEIVPLGEVAARKVSDRLAELSLSPEEYAGLRQRQGFVAKAAPKPVDEIRFEPLQRVNPESAKAIMITRVGEPIDEAVLDSDMRALYGTGDFEHVSYRYLQEGDKRILLVDAEEKPWGPDYLRLGLGLSTDFSGDANFNLLVSYRKTWLNLLGAEWRSDVQVGNTNSVMTEFYQPLNTDGLFFVAPHAGIIRTTVDLYQDNNRLAIYDVTSRLAGIDLGAHFYRYGELRIGVVGGDAEPSLDTGGIDFEAQYDSASIGGIRATLLFDQLDSVHFPRSGWRSVVNLYNSSNALGADSGYSRWEANGTGAFSFGEHTFNLSLVGGGAIGSDPLPAYDQFEWGGFLRQSGLRNGQLAGENLRYGRVMYYRRILRGGFLEGAYGGFSLELGQVQDPIVPTNSEDWLQSGSIFMAADSPIGPAYLGYGLTEHGDSSVYFYLGLPY